MNDLLTEYAATLSDKAPGTIDGYTRALSAFAVWVAERPGSDGQFAPEGITRTAVEGYMNHLETRGYSTSYRILVKAAISGFAEWLMDEKELLRRNPTRNVKIPAQALMAPRVLDDDQRYVLKNLVEREDDVRGAALFALGYWAGCRVSDVSWLLLANTHLNERSGWLTVGHKGNKSRQIDINREARQPLETYLETGSRLRSSAYVFTSQRSARLTEAGIHHWFRALKAQARKSEWDLIADISYHDLRHDFAHRARDAGWTLEELAFYLGHITKRGTPALQTTIRYTQASREQIKAKLKLLNG